MNFKEQLTERIEVVENIIKNYLPKEEGYQKTVLEAMNYSFLAGGKRLRPLMMREVYLAFGGEGDAVEPFMAALEMIHTYSLVHDDLPEMDNDALRRGLPTTHVKYGQAMAVLAGDALLNYSMETILNGMEKIRDSKVRDRYISAMQVMYHKSGIHGMIGGQVKDVEAEKNSESPDLNTILFIDECKTAALIQAAWMVGGIMAGASDKDIECLEKIGYNLGVAFQIQDDILDVTGTTEVLGKPVGSDEKNHKMTYVSYRGLQGAMEDQKKMSKEAIELVDQLETKNETDFLKELMLQLMQRKM